MSSFAQKQTQAAWRDLPSAYLLCEQDQALPVAAQEMMSQRAGSVTRPDSSHSPFLSQPKQVVRFLDELAATL